MKAHVVDALLDRCDRGLRLLERIAAGVEALASRPADGASNEGEAELWDVAQVAAYLKCSASKVRQYAADGRLPALPGVGRQLRFDPEAIKAWARGEQRPVGAAVVLLRRR